MNSIRIVALVVVVGCVGRATPPVLVRAQPTQNDASIAAAVDSIVGQENPQVTVCLAALEANQVVDPSAQLMTFIRSAARVVERSRCPPTGDATLSVILHSTAFDSPNVLSAIFRTQRGAAFG